MTHCCFFHGFNSFFLERERTVSWDVGRIDGHSTRSYSLARMKGVHEVWIAYVQDQCVRALR